MIKANQDFQVKIDDNLTTNNLRTITLIYKTIIGNNSSLLYMTLYALSSTELTYNHNYLLQALNVSESELDSLFAHLEATGLIESFYNEKFGYVYSIKRPSDPKDFLLENKFSFLDKVSEEQFKMLLQVFSIEETDLSSFKNVTRKFYKVFGPKKHEKKEVVRHVNPEPIKNTIPVKEELTFNFNEFVKKLEENKIIHRAFSNADRQQINATSKKYSLSVDEMCIVLSKATDDLLNIDNVILEQEAKKIFDLKPVVAPKRVDTNLSREERVVQEFDNATPSDIFRKFDYIISPSDVNNIEKLKTETKLPNGVINVLLAYVLQVKSDGVPAYNYLLKIASEWSMNQVKSTNDAIVYIQKKKEIRDNKKEFVEKETTPRYTNKKTTTKNTASQPNWVDEEFERMFSEK